MPKVTVRELLDAGMHYGHHTSRWNPKMKPYIFGSRNFIHIINLRETMRGLVTSWHFVAHVVASGKMALFVGTKRQARRIVREQALSCGMPFVTERWLGGTLTNFRTIRSRLDRLLELEATVEGPMLADLSKKEAARMKRELAKARRNLDGIRTMDHLPGVVIVVDPHREKNAVAEANRLSIPSVCFADTDSDPDVADVLIPGNDDAMRSIEVVLQSLAEAVLAGKEKRKEMVRMEADAAAAQSGGAAKVEALPGQGGTAESSAESADRKTQAPKSARTPAARRRRPTRGKRTRNGP